MSNFTWTGKMVLMMPSWFVSQIFFLLLMETHNRIQKDVS